MKIALIAREDDEELRFLAPPRIRAKHQPYEPATEIEVRDGGGA